MFSLGEGGAKQRQTRFDGGDAGTGAGDVLLLADARITAHLAETQRLPCIGQAALRHGELLLQTAQLEVVARGLRRDAHTHVVDRGVNIPEGLVVGEDAAFDSQWFRRTEGGVTLITQPMIDNYLASR